MQVIQSLFDLLEAHPFVTIAIWLLIIFSFLNLFGSWSKLTKRYATKYHFKGKTWKFQSASVGNTAYSNCVTVGSDHQGLYLSPFVIFRFGHPAILIPWEQLTLITEERFFNQLYYLEVADCSKIRIFVSDRLLHRISQSSQGHFTIRAQESQANQGNFSPPAQEISELLASPEPVNIQFRTKLFLKVFALTFALGLALGLGNHGLAQYQAWQYPERYSLYSLEEYTSPRYGNDGPDMLFECLGLGRPIRVKVEQQNGTLVSEYYYSIFGSVHQAKYRYGTWYMSGGGLFSTPLYTVNCLLPLVVGWIGTIGWGKKLERRARSSTNIQTVARFRTALVVLFHLGLVGITSLFLLYLIPNVIVTAFIDLWKYQG